MSQQRYTKASLKAVMIQRAIILALDSSEEVSMTFEIEVQFKLEYAEYFRPRLQRLYREMLGHQYKIIVKFDYENK